MEVGVVWGPVTACRQEIRLFALKVVAFLNGVKKSNSLECSAYFKIRRHRAAHLCKQQPYCKLLEGSSTQYPWEAPPLRVKLTVCAVLEQTCVFTEGKQTKNLLIWLRAAVLTHIYHLKELLVDAKSQEQEASIKCLQYKSEMSRQNNYAAVLIFL